MKGDLAAVLRLRPEAYVPDGEDVPDDAQSEPEEVTPEPAASRGAVTLRGGKLTTREQSAAALRLAVHVAMARWRELARREGGMVSGLLAAKPPSVTEECGYATDRSWVPAGHDGGWAERLGVLYHALIGRPGVAAGNTVSALCARPLRFFIAVAVLGALALIASLVF